jgi:hypothetical protein
MMLKENRIRPSGEASRIFFWADAGENIRVLRKNAKRNNDFIMACLRYEVNYFAVKTCFKNSRVFAGIYLLLSHC